MRVVFMGTPDIAATCLKRILDDGSDVVAVYTQPDRPKGRGMKLAFSPVKEVALAAGIPVYQPENFKEEETVQTLRDLKPDVVAVVAYGRILPQSVLDIPKFGCINIHASLLPKYRGSAPYQWAVLDGLKQTGVTAMYLVREMDAGGGIPPQSVRDVWGVIKAYTTRVGEGPFPTELFDDTGEKLRQVGREFGATTGRPRRCGWFDAVASRYACMVNGINKLAVTKLDCLDELDEIAICVAYKVNGVMTTEFPASVAELEAAEPVYEYMPGWKCSTSEVDSPEKLPVNAKNYLLRMAELVDSEIGIISVGPRRDQTFAVEALS